MLDKIIKVPVSMKLNLETSEKTYEYKEIQQSDYIAFLQHCYEIGGRE